MDSNSDDDSNSPTTRKGHGYGHNTKVGDLLSLKRTTWWEIRSIVMGAVKEALLGCLSAKHCDDWEFVAKHCFQEELKKKHVRNQAQDNYALLLRSVAEFFLSCKEDGLPKEQLRHICSIVTSSTSRVKWNEVLKDVQEQRRAEVESVKKTGCDEIQKQEQTNVSATIDCTVTSAVDKATTPAITSVTIPATNLVTIPAITSVTIPATNLVTIPVTTSVTTPLITQASTDIASTVAAILPVPSKAPSGDLTQISEKVWKHVIDKDVAVKASVSHKKYLEYEKRCKVYDDDRAITTAISIVTSYKEQEKAGGGGGGGGAAGGQDGKAALEVEGVPVGLAVVRNRLGYESAKIFCEKLDIMRNIINVYRKSNEEKEKDFLLSLISGSFTREEVNAHVLPPEANVMLPGRVRNTANISCHKWSLIRNASGKPRLTIYDVPLKDENGISVKIQKPKSHCKVVDMMHPLRTDEKEFKVVRRKRQVKTVDPLNPKSSDVGKPPSKRQKKN